MFLENILIFNVAVHLKHVGNQSANGRQLLGDRLKTRKSFYTDEFGRQKIFDAAEKPPADQNL